MSKAQNGRLGGLTTLRLHGRRHYRELRKASTTTGRPRHATFDEIQGDPRGARWLRAKAKELGVDVADL